MLTLFQATSQNSFRPTSTASSAKSSGLSTVGIAGISVGAGALVFLIAGTLAFFMWVRRRKQKALKSSQSLTSLSTYPNRGPPPPRPPRPVEPLSKSITAPPTPPPKDAISDRAFSPSPSITSSDFKKAREVEVYKVRNIEIRKKTPRDMDSKKSRSTYDSSNGPFELPSTLSDEKQQQMYEMYELYGGWPQSPSSSSHLMSSSKSFETLQTSSDPLWSNPSSPKPPSYGWQPVELETMSSDQETLLLKPQKSFATMHRHRRMPSGRWSRGTSWAPAELPVPDENGFL